MAKYLMVIILLFSSLTLPACEEISTPEQPVNESTPTREAITVSFTPSPTAPPLTPTPTSTLPPTDIPTPTATPSQIPKDIAPFHFMTSLAGCRLDSTGEVQVRALADGSVWILTSQKICRWDGQAWEVVLDESEGVLAAVDDGGRLWVLRQDTSEISAWQGGQWTSYGADRGWANPGYFEINWWATAPWNVYTDSGGVLWVPMEQDVRAFDGARWKVYTLEDMGFPVPEMEDISVVNYLATVEDSAELWVGECYYSGPGPMGGGGVRWFDGQTWQGADALVGRCVSAMHGYQMGDVWLAASKAVWYYKHTDQSWTKYQMPEALLSGYNFAHPRQLIIDKYGDVYVIEQMCGGASCDVQVKLYQIHDGEWSLVIDAEYWSSSYKQLVLDGYGQGWLFWDGMFYQFDEESLEPITSIDARAVDVSPQGSIWVVAGSGDEASLQALEP